MIFRQLIDRDLGCACYLLGDHGRGVVVDPGLDVERILAVAEEESLQIELIVETHVHADHVSGRALLAARTGASVRLPAGGGYDEGAGEPLHDGDELAVGDLRLTVLAAPGHRPEHIVVLVADSSRDPRPWLLLSGDSLLVGDLARPDLAVDPHDGAAALHATLTRLGALDGAVELWPGHVGGSLCGGPGLSRKTSSTLGFERAVNPLLNVAADEFASRLIAGLPARPPTVAAVVARNRGRVPAATATAALPLLDGAELARALQAGATLLDGRHADAFDAGHLPGALSLALGGSGLGTRAAWAVDPTDELVVLADDEAGALRLARFVRAVGLERVRGVVPVSDGGGLPALAAAAGTPLAQTPPIVVAELPRLLAGEAVTLVDVRDAPEWGRGHLARGIHLPLSRLRAEAGALPAGPLAVACASGGRAAFAASWLRAQGHDARRVSGGGIPDLPMLGVELVAA
ncbi:MBL fold metallo-hydrolase [Conexibacter sp. JD483]|uniref:MBL fold metallo-hydrolase n=1 Tax=unclassified Conexibacter TaxID=2627773 RepID=UPI00271CC6A5|nr:MULTISPECIES: MBL fold metallo-hydrolase [unclassified Conexibacter]MDO8188735.1 MBL fold metallo-hydrolase [Conexibacter sp. CPCC 205706]MDO8201262.1 MBL fold metallo-hydrolase [Conexibacter sp. CPCC 205762]MDR9370950.1 MBL fold metallo-hydrolase [Conexibacter sp. JD483]